MARGEAVKGSMAAGGTRKSRLAVLLAVVIAGTGLLSGCAGLASTANTNPTADEIQITPAALTFSDVNVGQSTTQSAVLTNTGTHPVSITQLSSSTAEFTTAGLSLPFTLAPGQSTQFRVAFRSSISGPVSGTLSAMTSRGGGSTIVKLNGNAGKNASQLSLSATSLKFGNVLVNGSSTQSFTVKNSGSTDVNISQLAINGTGFSASGVATPVTLSAGQSMTLQAKFAPTTAGAATGSVTITSNAQPTTSSVSLSGTGVSATYTMSLTPGSVSFGNVNVGSSGTQTVQLGNTGNSGVTVSQVTASGSGVSVSGLTAPVTIAPSQSVPITVKFAPTISGAVAGSVTVTNSGGINTVAAVTGTGVQAGISVIPSIASFGTVVTGTTNSQTIQVKNNGTASLTVSQVSATGAGYSISGLTLPLNLTAGQTGSFNVQYAPNSAGAVTGSISIVSNAPNSPATVALSGTGVAATTTLSVRPGSLSFGSVNDGSAASQGFTVTNTGNSNVSVSSIIASGTGYSILSGAGAVTLSPNQSTSVSVQFAPKTAGAASGSVSIASNASGSPATVTLSGTGVAPQIQHSIALTWGASTSTVAGYNVYRSTVSGGSYSRLNSTIVVGVSFSDPSVQSGQTYYYTATSVNASGSESAYSNEVTAVVP